MKITSTNKVELHKFNLAVIGMSKTGKTHLTSTIKGKALICNADKGGLTLAGCDIKTVKVTTYNEFVEFMKFVTTSKQFVTMGFDWVVFDSVSAIAEILKTHLEDAGVTGFDFWGEYRKILGGLATTTRDTERFNSLSIYEVEEKENKNGLLEKKFGIEGSLRSKMSYFYDFVLATKKIVSKDKEDEYQLMTTNEDGYGFLGGRSSKVKLNKREPANINHIIKKLKS